MKESEINFTCWKVTTLDGEHECAAARVWVNDANEPVGLTLTVVAGKIFVPWSRVTGIFEAV
jgi:hypothetical protein